MQRITRHTLAVAALLLASLPLTAAGRPSPPPRPAAQRSLLSAMSAMVRRVIGVATGASTSGPAATAAVTPPPPPSDLGAGLDPDGIH